MVLLHVMIYSILLLNFRSSDQIIDYWVEKWVKKNEEK